MCPTVSWVPGLALKLTTSWGKKSLPHGRTACFDNVAYLLPVVFLKREGPLFRYHYNFWAHGWPWQSLENHFVSLTGILSYVGAKRMVWLSNNLLWMALQAPSETFCCFGLGSTGAWWAPRNSGLQLQQCSISPRLTVQNLFEESTLMLESSS